MKGGGQPTSSIAGPVAPGRRVGTGVIVAAFAGRSGVDFEMRAASVSDLEPATQAADPASARTIAHQRKRPIMVAALRTLRAREDGKNDGQGGAMIDLTVHPDTPLE